MTQIVKIDYKSERLKFPIEHPLALGCIHVTNADESHHYAVISFDTVAGRQGYAIQQKDIDNLILILTEISSHIKAGEEEGGH